MVNVSPNLSAGIPTCGSSHSRVPIPNFQSCGGIGSSLSLSLLQTFVGSREEAPLLQNGAISNPKENDGHCHHFNPSYINYLMSVLF